MTVLNPRLRGLAAVITLVAFVAGVPAVLLAIDAVPDLSAFSWSRLTAPDDGILVIEVLAVVCWIAWAVFTGQVAASIAAHIRGMRAPRLPGLALPQLAADRLVAAAALLFVAVPSATALLPEPDAQAVVATAPLPDTVDVSVPPVDSVVATAIIEQQSKPEVERYTVKRGDSLWRIAEDRLGDGSRYVELVELNETVLDGRPDFLLPGTVLRVPVPKAAAPDAYVVQPGDTLSEIAEAELGDSDAYPAIFEASRDTVQADGTRLTDPDLILPGWKLTIPAQETTTKSPRPERAETPAETPPAVLPPTEATPPETADEPTATEPRETEAREGADDVTVPGWLLPGLAGAGSVLGGALWLVLRAQRRTQLRHRRPGTIIPPPPPELLDVEKTAHATASVMAPRIEALDAALRALSPPPRLLTATLGSDAICLTLSEPADLPEPWSGSDAEWRIALGDVPDSPEDSFPPFPLLVSVGQAADGSFLLLNLEELRTVSVTGDTDRRTAFGRHLAAELAVNSWSIVTTVDLLGLGRELDSFNLGRVHAHPSGDTDFIAALARDLSSIRESHDPDDFHAAIIATTNRPASDLDRLAEVIEGTPGRASAALVDLAGEPRTPRSHLHLTADGRLQAPSLGVDVTAAGLSEDEARACAMLLDLTLQEEVMRVPEADDETEISDLGGALTDRLTEPRPPEGPAGDESLLPLEAHVYADAAATTVEDVAALAPQATPEARPTVEAADPSLDEDLARWESSAPTATKLTLLGPVGARTTGDTKATAHRRPFYVELLAYLALHPHGVSGQQVADAFGLRPERVRVDMSQLRRWLGADPHTGQPYLPKAEPGREPDSPALYKLEGVLTDLDLFRRLRARGQSRGADGIADLIAGLRMVSGEPFTYLREGHWTWLLEGDRWDHIMTSAIVDVAHIVATRALAEGDHDQAMWAARVAYTAAPYDEIAQLDMIQAEKAAGDDARAGQEFDERILNRRDDELAPIDLPDRTARVIHNQKLTDSSSRPRKSG